MSSSRFPIPQGTLDMLILQILSLDRPRIRHRTMMQNTEQSVPARFETMQEMFGESLAYPRFRTQLIGAFAGMAALLAAVVSSASWQTSWDNEPGNSRWGVPWAPKPQT